MTQGRQNVSVCARVVVCVVYLLQVRVPMVPGHSRHALMKLMLPMTWGCILEAGIAVRAIALAEEQETITPCMQTIIQTVESD